MSWRLETLLDREPDRLKDIPGQRCASFAEEDLAALADDDDSALNPGAILPNRAVRLGDFPAFVHDQVEGQVELLDERPVTGSVCRVDPEGDDARLKEPFDRRANGGQLVPSASGHIRGVEDQQDMALLVQIAEAVLVALSAFGIEVGRHVTDLRRRTWRWMS